jgi:hypothetical protein
MQSGAEGKEKLRSFVSVFIRTCSILTGKDFGRQARPRYALHYASSYERDSVMRIFVKRVSTRQDNYEDSLTRGGLQADHCTWDLPSTRQESYPQDRVQRSPVLAGTGAGHQDAHTCPAQNQRASVGCVLGSWQKLSLCLIKHHGMKTNGKWRYDSMHS